MDRAGKNTARRKKLGIPHYSDRPWTDKDDRLLGTRSDAEIAYELGRSRRAIRERRKHFGIPQWHYEKRDWTIKELRQLGTMSDQDLARKLKRTLSAVVTKRMECEVPVFHSKCRRWEKRD